jgi:hypothetical protein
VLFFHHVTERVFFAILRVGHRVSQCRAISILVAAMGEPADPRLCYSVPNKCHKRSGGANTLVFPARPVYHFHAHVSQTDGFTPPACRISEGAYQRAARP